MNTPRFLAFALALAFAAPAAAQGSLDVVVPLPPLQLSNSEAGIRLAMDGTTPFGPEGDPALLTRPVVVVLPQVADLDTLEVELSVTRSHVAHLGAAVAPNPARMEGRVEIPREDGLQLVEGKNLTIYGQGAFYPPEVLRGLRVDRAGGWKVVVLSVCPVRYSDLQRDLLVAEELTISCSFSELDPGTLAPVPPSDRVQRLVVELGFQPWEGVESSYDVAPEGEGSDPNYLIITTDTIEAERDDNGLDAFYQHMKRMGFRPVIFTKTLLYAFFSGADLPERIRACIGFHHTNYGLEHVLLVGNPDPHALNVDPGVIPMRECAPGGEYAMTDLYYADVDGNWDVDGDGLFAEDWSETGSPDVHVGRVAPVGGYTADTYSGLGEVMETLSRTEKLRAAFEQLIRYDLQLDRAWRDDTLVIGSYMASGDDSPNAAWALEATEEAIAAANPASSALTVYQDGNYFGWPSDPWFDGSATPHPDADVELRGDACRTDSSAFDEWAAGRFGFIYWAGHGSCASVGVGDGPAYSDDGSFVERRWIQNAARTSTVDPDHPAVVFAGSCLNFSVGTKAFDDGDFTAQRSEWGSLAQSLQYRGGVAVCAATHYLLGPSNFTDTPPAWSPMWEQRQFLTGVAAGLSFGDARWLPKYVMQSVSAPLGIADAGLKNWLRLNFLGDPAQALRRELPDDQGDDGAGDDTSADATVLYSLPFPPPITVNVSGALCQDADWYTLNSLGSGPKSITVTLTRDGRLADLGLMLQDGSGSPILGMETSNDAQKVLHVSSTSASAIFLRVSPLAGYANGYELTVEVTP